MDSYTNDTEIHRPKSHWFTTSAASDQKSWGSLEILGIACGIGAAIRPYRYGCAAPAAPLPSHPSPSPRIELLDAGIQMAGLSSRNFLMWPDDSDDKVHRSAGRWLAAVLVLMVLIAAQCWACCARCNTARSNQDLSCTRKPNS